MQTNIKTTVFGGVKDREKSAYDGHLIGSEELCCALPFRFSGRRPKVRVHHKGKSVLLSIEDVGPWNFHDPYWINNRRPQAESHRDMSGRLTNHAGIDISLAAAKALGIHGDGTVDWEFVEEEK